MEKAKILIVDDSKVDQLIIENILRDYTTITANDGIDAIEKLKKNNDIDIMILDINMPRMDGFEVLEIIKRDFNHLDFSVLILTNYEEIENEIKGLELGAVDYIRKPLNAESLLKRLEVHANLLLAKKNIKRHNQSLEQEVLHRTKQLLRTRDVTINALVSLLEIRDIESCDHTKRTSFMIKVLSLHLKKSPKYADYLSDEKIESIYKTAPLHDIGKVGIADVILLKPGKLTEEEFALMKEHVNFGVEALTMELQDEYIDIFLSTALNIIESHHEKFDGSGYPSQITGENIPLEGRLMSIIDVYDALTSKRVYKEAFSHEASMAIIIGQKGKHFDPEIVNAFVEIQDQIVEISRKFRRDKEVYLGEV